MRLRSNDYSPTEQIFKKTYKGNAQIGSIFMVFLHCKYFVHICTYIYIVDVSTYYVFVLKFKLRKISVGKHENAKKRIQIMR